jgi:hypothetical protein
MGGLRREAHIALVVQHAFFLEEEIGVENDMYKAKPSFDSNDDVDDFSLDFFSRSAADVPQPRSSFSVVSGAKHSGIYYWRGRAWLLLL